MTNENTSPLDEMAPIQRAVDSAKDAIDENLRLSSKPIYASTHNAGWEEVERQVHQMWKVHTADYTEDEFIYYLEANFLPKSHVQAVVEELRRTDETQMSHDHVYDEALDDVLSRLNLGDSRKDV
jgi:hypothetical protein